MQTRILERVHQDRRDVFSEVISNSTYWTEKLKRWLRRCFERWSSAACRDIIARLLWSTGTKDRRRIFDLGASANKLAMSRSCESSARNTCMRYYSIRHVLKGKVNEPLSTSYNSWILFGWQCMAQETHYPAVTMLWNVVRRQYAIYTSYTNVCVY